jgi:N-methylhydantoinase A
MASAVDTGGTFTDCVYIEDGKLQVLKVFSTPDDPARAVLNAVKTIATDSVRHGTTVGTNALLERKGARVAFVTTAGFEDTIAIGRQARTDLYDWFATPLPCIVPAELRFGVPERTAPDGTILRRPTEAELDVVTERVRESGADSIAISLLFSFANPENEIAVKNALSRLKLPVSVSHVVLPEFREYERASTVTVNAYLAPKLGGYLGTLANDISGRLDVMQSSGGIVPARIAAEQPVRTVLSGPAGGVIGAYAVAKLAGFDKIITFDMGGTSTDVCLVGESGPNATKESIVSHLPVSVPMLDIHTVGAGGGSLAWFDAGGVLHVGPESAGAEPGPICYGRGTQPTVTDANLMLRRLDTDYFLDGAMRLDYERTRQRMESARGAIGSVEEFACGIVRIAESTMERAIRVISVERGFDPREFTLVAFGGAGPLHACALARALQIRRVLIPAMPGALSALGILLADTVRDYSKTVMLKSDADLEPHFEELERTGLEDLRAEGLTGISARSVDVRYAGQGYELNIPVSQDLAAGFHRAHKQRYGYADPSRTVEVVNVRVRMTAPAEPYEFKKRALRGGDGAVARIKTANVVFDGAEAQAGVYDRDWLIEGDRISGPAMIVEYSSTTIVPPGCTLSVDPYKNIVIEVA